MRLRRFEFGISRTTAASVEVYARRGDGRLFMKEYPAATEDVLAQAEADFLVSSNEWLTEAPPPSSKGLSLVWDAGCRLHVSGEASITANALADAGVDVIISMNVIKSKTRLHIEEYLEEAPEATHHDLPMFDVLPKFQREEGRLNAIVALDLCEQALRDGQTVLVHCLMGIHRSVSVASVGLTRASLAPTPRDAFGHIHSQRPVASWIPETVAWLEALPCTRPRS